jgi:uroporphyrinogen-III decarboxylase
MDAVVWLMGAVEAVMMAIDHPKEFGLLVDLVAKADFGRTELAALNPGVDIVVQRGWYSSTDLWSPKLFDLFVVPHLKELVDLAHRHQKKFGYVITTGVEKLGPRLADAGVDVLYFLDPLQDGIHLDRARCLLSDRITLVGGINALSLSSCDERQIKEAVNRALECLGSTHRFILHPVDALFPDTAWEGVEIMIDAWRAGQK